MGKAKGNSSSKGKEAATPKCMCDHPYICSCGNRPPRPSKGHKWDPETQQWRGKGHKQKGASGQSRVVGEQAQTTAVGQTQVAQWQRLPSALLREYCEKQKRPQPKFKELSDDPKKFKSRCIVPDGKDPEKDLILIPKQAVGNQEQAQEEAALLALLQLTPNLPHERKLPEPYRTTWMTAVQAQKSTQQQQPKSGKSNDKSSSNSSATSGGGNQKATANTNLVLGTSHISSAERRKEQEQRKRERNARIRRHEAVRMANRNHPVFLSAKLRQQIQRLLQGKDFQVNPADDDDEDENSPEWSQFSSDRQQYVEERLHHEGFTKKQARKAFEQLSSKVLGKNDAENEEDKWEECYEECLQWLCVHLREDQLPEGFDPRGQTLEVVAPSNKTPVSTTTGKGPTDTEASTGSASPEAQELAKKFGLLDVDAMWLLEQAKKMQRSVEEVLWDKIVELADVSLHSENEGGETNIHSPLAEEIEALEAMFPEGVVVYKSGNYTTVVIPTSEELILTIVLDQNSYPLVFPKSVLCSGAKEWTEPGVGVGFHVELTKCLSTMTLGEPMLFELFTQVQTLQQTMNELPKMTLSSIMRNPSLAAGPETAKQVERGESASRSTKSKSKVPRASFRARRPRERGVFWSTSPGKTPPATAFPKLSTSLNLQRKGLPAGKAREDFLSILREAVKVRMVSYRGNGFIRILTHAYNAFSIGIAGGIGHWRYWMR